MDWSSLLPGRNVTNEDLVKGLIQEGRLQHPRAAQAMLKANLCSDNKAAQAIKLLPHTWCMKGAYVGNLSASDMPESLQVDRKFFIQPDMHESEAYQVKTGQYCDITNITFDPSAFSVQCCHATSRNLIHSSSMMQDEALPIGYSQTISAPHI